MRVSGTVNPVTSADESPLSGVDLRALPKISLHDHLDGGVRPATIIELAEAIGVDVPVSDPDGLADWFYTQCNAGSLVEYLKTFDLSTAVMQTEEGLVRIAREFVQDLAADGVIYGEVRWAPEQHLTRGLSLDAVVEAVQEGIELGVKDAAHSGSDIQIGQLVTAMRHADRALEIAELAVRHRERGVVGFDIAGAEAGFPASKHRLAFDYLAAELFPVTVHAGEADGIESIRSALLDGRALRLGHGVRIAEDIFIERDDAESLYATLGPVAEWVRDRKIPLELSPQSNLQTGAIAAWGEELEDHPFDLLYQLDFAVTVNVDNRTMSDTSLTKELALLSEAFDYDLTDLETFQLNAAAATFQPLEIREALADRISEAFDEFLDDDED
ncbi:adenosine deaminase [Plantibacter sp. MCCC 1A11337]|uniref:adenosine deaminase n=1 Tax=unclassified Plantibacter TaxID=2624265 RepID=UPI0007D99A90|nr:adenosine deaminase [Plantibacter sp. MCCC 1A11337]OAN34264.1 adenosine deaminase [Plantibacter sp. H53]OII34381.1 adenosine deaminase [Plantibacter sp. MMLR14_011]